MAFVHLHVHSQFSILNGTMSPKDLIAGVAALGQTAVALTDTSNLFAAFTFFKEGKGKGIKPIIGAELVVQPEGLAHLPDQVGVGTGSPGGGKGDFFHGAHGQRGEGGSWPDRSYQIEVLVEDDEGYRNLSALLTQAIFEGIHYRPRVDLELLRAHHKGLIVLTGGIHGVLGEPGVRGDRGEALRRVRELAAIFDPDHLYLELQDVGLDGQEEINDLVRALSREEGLQTVVTNAVHYARPEDAVSHELLAAIATGRSLHDPDRIVVPTDQAYLKSEEELREVFPDDEDAIQRTAEIAARVHFKMYFADRPEDYHFPSSTPPDLPVDGVQPDTDANWAFFYQAFPPPRAYGLPDPTEAIPPRREGAGNLDGYFDWYAREGLALRLKKVQAERHPEYEERLNIELATIKSMQFPAYLLIVAEFINWSKDNGIPVGPGRGSAAGSLVAWAMRITDIDPIRFDLLFERFLNPERVSMPDIDVDFCQDRREEAIVHVRDKYGADLVSQIITFGTLRAKAAIRDVARVLGIGPQDADYYAKLVPDELNITLDKALEQVEALRVMRANDPRFRRLWDLAAMAEGAIRQTGVHAAGVVVADRPLVEYAPLYRDSADGGPVVQYAMKSAEGIGLIKFDFLGLKTLDQIRDAVAMIERNHGVSLDMADVDEDDEPTYHLLQEGDTLGVFQLESSGMRELLGRLKPNVLDDLVALVALYRPGPLKSGFTDNFVLRKHNPELVAYAHPILEPILKSTYGTVVYQEQVMQIAQVMAKYSLGGADLLRRAMGKKDDKIMQEQASLFVAGAIDNGIDGALAHDIFEQLRKFAEYGFNKSHSAAYGYISYQTAWLKTHYRPEYMAALMTIESANTDKVLAYIGDCRRAGIRVLPVCLNRSQLSFDVPPPGERPDGDVIRFGLSAVKNVGTGAVEAILEAREAAGGRFRDPLDFFDRVDYGRVNRRVVESLVKAGAFDFTGESRAALLEGIEAAMKVGLKSQRDRLSGQVSLFGAVAQPVAQRLRFPDVPPWPKTKRLQLEKEVLGLYLTGHPMESWTKDVERFLSVPIHRLAELDEEKEVRLVGVPSEVKTVKTKRGDKMAFVQLEDGTGTVECTFFSEPWSRSQRVIKSGEPVVVTGRIERTEEDVKFLASTAVSALDKRRQTINLIRIQLLSDELTERRLAALEALFAEQRGRHPATVVLRVPGQFDVEIELQQALDPSSDLEEGLEVILGRPGALILV
ncbi:MAG: DNA polymerase III subunit alpha [Deltaproteobacteria bacterium]|nr:DNA polymerase III subunit alpha [Deltaproteobacteria bacterium]